MPAKKLTTSLAAAKLTRSRKMTMHKKSWRLAVDKFRCFLTFGASANNKNVKNLCKTIKVRHPLSRQPLLPVLPRSSDPGRVEDGTIQRQSIDTVVCKQIQKGGPFVFNVHASASRIIFYFSFDRQDIMPCSCNGHLMATYKIYCK